jgi:hypothetical protein
VSERINRTSHLSEMSGGEAVFMGNAPSTLICKNEVKWKHDESTFHAVGCPSAGALTDEQFIPLHRSQWDPRHWLTSNGLVKTLFSCVNWPGADLSYDLDDCLLTGDGKL